MEYIWHQLSFFKMVISCFNSILKAFLFFKHFNNFILNYYVLNDHILDVNLDSLLASYQTSVQILYPRKTHNANKQWRCPQIDTVGQQIGLYLLLRHSKSEHWLKTQLLRLHTNSAYALGKAMKHGPTTWISGSM